MKTQVLPLLLLLPSFALADWVLSIKSWADNKQVSFPYLTILRISGSRTLVQQTPKTMKGLTSQPLRPVKSKCERLPCRALVLGSFTATAKMATFPTLLTTTTWVVLSNSAYVYSLFNIQVNGKQIAKTTKESNTIEYITSAKGSDPAPDATGKTFWNPTYTGGQKMVAHDYCHNGYLDDWINQNHEIYGLNKEALLTAFGQDVSPIWIGSCMGENEDKRMSFRHVITSEDLQAAINSDNLKVIFKTLDLDDKNTKDAYFQFQVGSEANCDDESGYCNCDGAFCTEDVVLETDNFLFCK
jgi:hypothetical protein